MLATFPLPEEESVKIWRDRSDVVVVVVVVVVVAVMMGVSEN